MVKSTFAFLATAVAASELDESGLLQNRKVSRHGGLQCFTVQKGDVAPVEGEFVDASDEKVSVHVGDVADQDGQFCVSAEVAALLERTHGLEYAETSNFDEAIKKKKKNPLKKGVMTDEEIKEYFSLSSIGPFPLVKRADLTLVGILRMDNEFVVKSNESTMVGSLSTSMSLDEDGSSYWLGANEVDWAYQPSAGVDEDASGSFEAYGGFIFNDAVYEIGGSEDDPEMTMHFGWPFKMTEKDWAKCKNPAPVTIQSMLDAGAQEYCWEVDHDYCERGCFIYKTSKGYQGFYVKDFALESIGPFYLKETIFADFIGPVTVRGKKYETSSGRKGKISTGMKELGTAGRNFWFNSAEVSWAYQGKDVDEVGLSSFEKYGGFLLRTDDGTVTSVLEIAESDYAKELTLEFGHPFEISKKEWKKCQNPADVTIDPMIEAGAQKYCWEQHWDRCPRGCFFYQTTDGYQAFAVQDFAMASLGPLGFSEHVSDTSSIQDLLTDTVSNTWTLDNETGRLSAGATVDWMGQWDNAAQVQWMYPAEEADDAAGSFEKSGGFLISANKQTKIMEIDMSSDQKLSFEDPMHITKDQFEAGCGGTYQPITLSTLLSIGTEQYCWVVPGTQDWCGENGCFIYKTRTGYQSFAVHPTE